MRLLGGIFAGSGLLILASASFAQSEDENTAFTPEDDLDCAMYVGALMAESQAEMTPESRAALTSAFTYFTGRYEALRGTGLTEAFTARYPAYAASDPQQIAQTCSVRMRAFGARLERAGRAMAEMMPSETEAPADSQPAG
ncbi:DNA polymerase III subunit beta [Erythrobacter sp. NAP1]|uniref:hypothetical protein n=1 Tax=Erythrobacter sp. NAP1 TaxID=237727 RepID=UPI0000686B98|nr:hypothetical protein [Erythrobacter sp. NAP1]EAQ30413.1 DNA polymerase III subunit beta [Erythrobacter sp. NAP1]